MNSQRLMTTREVAALLQVPVSTIYRWRYVGGAPMAIQVGRHLRFRESAINDWLAAREERDSRDTGEHR